MSEAKGMKAFREEANEMGMGFREQLHAYAYFKWTARYIGWLRNHTLPNANEQKRKHWEEHYHAKVLPLPLAEAIISLDHDIPLTDLEQIVPYELARDLLLHSPTDVTLYECGCRGSVENPCQPTRVCMVIGRPFAEACVAMHPDKSHKATTEEALRVLKEEEERGHIHTAWFKDVALGRFYAICNCCKCCCAGIQAMNEFGMRTIAPSGYSAKFEVDRCKACGKCAKACPFGAITFEEKKVRFNYVKCMGCGICSSICEKNAWSLALDAKKGIPMNVAVIPIVGKDVKTA